VEELNKNAIVILFPEQAQEYHVFGKLEKGDQNGKYWQ